MSSQILLAIAGLGSLSAAIMHSILGERYFIAPIIARMDWSGVQRSHRFANKIVRLAWHVTSLMWLAFAGIFIVPIFGFGGVLPVYVIAAAVFAATFWMTGFNTNWRHRGWPIFALITAALSAALLLALPA